MLRTCYDGARSFTPPKRLHSARHTSMECVERRIFASSHLCQNVAMNSTKHQCKYSLFMSVFEFYISCLNTRRSTRKLYFPCDTARLVQCLEFPFTISVSPGCDFSVTCRHDSDFSVTVCLANPLCDSLSCKYFISFAGTSHVNIKFVINSLQHFLLKI